MRDHEPIVINRFMGLWDRSVNDPNGRYGTGEPETAPIDHAIECNNIIFNNDGIRTRPGMVMVQALVTGLGLFRKHTFKFSGGDRDLVMDATRRLIDRQTAAVLVTGPIGSTDFALINMYDRCYVSFFNGSGQGVGNLYVYDGTTFRQAGGTAPGGAITAVPGVAGKIEFGYRAFAVAFETASGFITKPGAYVTYTAAPGFAANLSTIPLGPAGTVARHVLATKTAYTGWSLGNYNDVEFFFLPGGRIGDNVTTTHVADYFDADLKDSSDYLLDEIVTIPAGSCLANMDGRLCISGFASPNEAMVRVSARGEPESFSEIDGFILFSPGDGGIITCVTTHRDTLVMMKEQRTAQTFDNGLSPAEWIVVPVDNSIGTPSNYGVSKVLDVQGPSVDHFILLSRTGLEYFDGSYHVKPLSWKISDIWSRITPTTGFGQVIQDTINKRIYVSLNLDASATRVILMGDYELGLDPDNMRWSVWTFPVSAKSISLRIDTATKLVLFEFMDADSNLFKLDYNWDTVNDLDASNNAVAVNDKYHTAFLPDNQDGARYHFTELKARILGVDGTMNVEARGLDFNDDLPIGIGNQLIVGTLPFNSASGRLRKCGPFNVISERLSFIFSLNQLHKVWEMRQLLVYIKPVWEDRAPE